MLKIITTAPVRYAGWHTAGTARMGSNKINSVVKNMVNLMILKIST